MTRDPLTQQCNPTELTMDKSCHTCFTERPSGNIYPIPWANGITLWRSPPPKYWKAEMAISKYLWTREPDCYSRILKVMPRWEKCTYILGDFVQNNDTAVEQW